MDFFLLFSGLYLLLILSLTLLVFLWILGASKTHRDLLLSSHPPAFRRPSPHSHSPLSSTPDAIHVVPRRLSFSAAAATPTPLRAPPQPRHTPTNPPLAHEHVTPARHNSARRVTFSLTPEQQRSEALKARAASPGQSPYFDDTSAIHHPTPTPPSDVTADHPMLVELFPATSFPPVKVQRQSPRRARARAPISAQPQPQEASSSTARSTREERGKRTASLQPEPTERPSDDGTDLLVARVRAEGDAFRKRSRRSEERVQELEKRGFVVPEGKDDQQVAGFVPRRRTAFENGPVAFRGFEGEAVMFASGRKRRGVTMA